MFSPYVVFAGAPKSAASDVARPSPRSVLWRPGSSTKFLSTVELIAQTSPICSMIVAIAIGTIEMIDVISKFDIADSRGSNYIGWKIIDYGEMRKTEFGKISHDSYKILRQICEATDTKSSKKLQHILKQHKDDPALKEAINAYASAIMQASSNTQHLSILRENVKLLESFIGTDWKPDFNYLVFYNSTSLPVFYDISIEETLQLQNIFLNLNNKNWETMSEDGVDYM